MPCKRAASACSRRTRCTGPTGCERMSAGAAISTKPRSIPFSHPPTPAAPMLFLAVRSSGRCSGHLPRPNSSSTPVRAFMATQAAACGATITESPGDGSALQPSPFLVKTRGAEVGVRSKLVPGLTSAMSVFLLDSASEIIFSGDAGDTKPSRPSRRYGLEWTNDYRPLSWLSLEGDIAVTHARFRGDDPDQAALYASLAGFPAAQIGNAPGNYIPGAPNMIASAGIRLGERTGWFAGLRYRYFGPRPLTEDGAFVSPATGLLNGRLGYRFENGWRVQLDGFNLRSSRSDQITYAYVSVIKSDSLFAMCFPAGGTPASPAAVCQTGVMDRVLHPVEPLAIRLTVIGQF